LYVGHIVATVLDKSPTACRRGRCTLVGCCVCPGPPPVANCQGSGATVRRLAATSTLTRRLLPAVRGQGYCSSVGCCVCLDTPLVAICQGSGRLVWHVGSAALPVNRGDSWSVAGPSGDTSRSGRAEDAGSTWLSRDMAEMGTLCSSPRWTEHYWPYQSGIEARCVIPH
ncbi:hypothetical protein GW17_00052820, partial [Ensete ventricosum]